MQSNQIKPWDFFSQILMASFSLKSSDSKSPQVSRTLVCILADLNNAAVCMVLILPLIFVFACILSGPFLPFQMHQLQFVSLSLPCARTSLALLQNACICLSFHFLSFSLCCPLEWQNPRVKSFFFCKCWDLKVFENFICLIFLDSFWFVHISFVCTVKL